MADKTEPFARVEPMWNQLGHKVLVVGWPGEALAAVNSTNHSLGPQASLINAALAPLLAEREREREAGAKRQSELEQSRRLLDESSKELSALRAVGKAGDEFLGSIVKIKALLIQHYAWEDKVRKPMNKAITAYAEAKKSALLGGK